MAAVASDLAFTAYVRSRGEESREAVEFWDSLVQEALRVGGAGRGGAGRGRKGGPRLRGACLHGALNREWGRPWVAGGLQMRVMEFHGRACTGLPLLGDGAQAPFDVAWAAGRGGGAAGKAGAAGARAQASGQRWR